MPVLNIASGLTYTPFNPACRDHPTLTTTPRPKALILSLSKDMKTLKTEEVNGKAFKDIDHARSEIGHFIDTVYNTERLHSALGYRPPLEFEADFRLSINP